MLAARLLEDSLMEQNAKRGFTHATFFCDHSVPVETRK
jgi:hypothetical protein